MKAAMGFGVADFRFAFCINNRLPLDDYADFSGMRSLQPGEIHYITQRSSNHWRKLFNVFAKCVFELGGGQTQSALANTWQEYRDAHLLQAHAADALLFSEPQLGISAVQVVAGKTYGLQLPWPTRPINLGDGFFRVPEQKIIISPYLDYRQLSNQRIAQLVDLVRPWVSR